MISFTFYYQLLLLCFCLLHAHCYTVQTSSLDCKQLCLDKGKIFCPTSDKKMGYCCELGERCPNEFKYCSTDFTSLAMKNFLCPFDSVCGTNNYVLLASEQLQTYGVKNNLFTNNSICAYSFQMPSSAVDGDALYVKLESVFNADVEINQSKDLVTFGQAYTLRAGSFVNIN